MSGISLVIPCFNQAVFVSAAIKSALAQDVRPAEIIVVDDGSTDGSADRVAGFGDAIYLLRQPNRGAAAARNAGVRQARQPLLAFLDGDDLWPPQSLAVRLALLQASHADFVFGGVSQFHEGDRFAPGPHRPIAGRMIGAMLIRREAFARVGPFDERLGSAEVIDWTARAAALGLTHAATPDIVLLRRIHGGNMMITTAGTGDDRMAVLRANLQRKRAAGAA